MLNTSGVSRDRETHTQRERDRGRRTETETNDREGREGNIIKTKSNGSKKKERKNGVGAED